MKDLLVQAALALSPLFLALLAWIAKRLADYLAAKVQSEYLKGALTRLDYAVANAVQSVEQSMVAAMRDETGALKPNAAQAAKDAALAAAKSYLGSKGWSEVQKILGLDTGEASAMLMTHIESAVGAMKLKQAAVGAVPTPAAPTLAPAAPTPHP